MSSSTTLATLPLVASPLCWTMRGSSSRLQCMPIDCLILRRDGLVACPGAWTNGKCRVSSSCLSPYRESSPRGVLFGAEKRERWWWCSWSSTNWWVQVHGCKRSVSCCLQQIHNGGSDRSSKAPRDCRGETWVESRTCISSSFSSIDAGTSLESKTDVCRISQAFLPRPWSCAIRLQESRPSHSTCTSLLFLFVQGFLFPDFCRIVLCSITSSYAIQCRFDFDAFVTCRSKLDCSFVQFSENETKMDTGEPKRETEERANPKREKERKKEEEKWVKLCFRQERKSRLFED